MWRPRNFTAEVLGIFDELAERPPDQNLEAVSDGLETVAYRGLRLVTGTKRSALTSMQKLCTSDGLDFLNSKELEVVDKVLAVGFAIIATPLALAGAGMTYLEDGSPVLYHTPRVGLNGDVFKMLKLRTMFRDADVISKILGNRHFGALPHDPRHLPITSKLLRSFLDESPQLLHVLKGEMAMAGIRTIDKRERDLWSVRGLEGGMTQTDIDHWFYIRGLVKGAAVGYEVAGRRRGQHYTYDTLPLRLESDEDWINSADLPRYFGVIAGALTASLVFGNRREAAQIVPEDHVPPESLILLEDYRQYHDNNYHPGKRLLAMLGLADPKYLIPVPNWEPQIADNGLPPGLIIPGVGN